MRVPLNKRELYKGSAGEDTASFVLSIIAGAVTTIMGIICLLVASIKGEALGIVISSLALSCMTAYHVFNCIYHAAAYSRTRRIFDILKEDFSLIVILTFHMFILLCLVIETSVATAWIILGIEIAILSVGATIVSVGLKHYNLINFICKILMLCSIFFIYKPVVNFSGTRTYMALIISFALYALSFVLQFFQDKKEKLHVISIILFIMANIAELLTLMFFVI